jgi:hypothetical protein
MNGDANRLGRLAGAFDARKNDPTIGLDDPITPRPPTRVPSAGSSKPVQRAVLVTEDRGDAAAPIENRKFKGGCICPKLIAIKKLFGDSYYFSDDNVIDLVLGVVAGNHLDSDPLWLHLISPPSGGKTELLNSVFSCDETFFLSDFTAASLISGYRDDGKDKTTEDDGGDDQEDASDEDEYSLLPKLNGKTVVTKDFSIIHDKPSETRAQILAILRDVYDGYASRALGNSAPKGFHSRFNYLTGMTPDIEKSWSLNTLGERFLMYRIGIENRREHARRSLNNANKTADIRGPLQAAVKEFIDNVSKTMVPAFDDKMQELILDLSELLSTCRTYVSRERNDEMTFLPQAELASRVAKQLLRVGQSVALVRGKSQITMDEFAIMKRIALDSLPTNRRHMVKALWDLRGAPASIEAFEVATGLAKTTTRRVIEDLCALGAVHGQQTPHTIKGKIIRINEYQWSDDFAKYCQQIGGI